MYPYLINLKNLINPRLTRLQGYMPRTRMPERKWTDQDSRDLAEATRRMRIISNRFSEITGSGIPPRAWELAGILSQQVHRERQK
jgi:hypothetical protein